MLQYLKLLLQLILAPSKGWEDVEAANPSSHRALVAGLLPLVFIAALSVGVAAIWEIHPRVSTVVIRAVVTFAVYMLTYFIAIAVLNAVLPRLTFDGTIDHERIRLFASFDVAMMAIIGILENLLPMNVALLQFMPIYLIIVFHGAMRYLNIDAARVFAFIGISIVAIIVPVYLVGRILAPMTLG